MAPGNFLENREAAGAIFGLLSSVWSSLAARTPQDAENAKHVCASRFLWAGHPAAPVAAASFRT